MGEFSGTPGWRLVNSHTIHTDHQLHDRPMMLTCVPKTVDVDVTAFEVVRYVEWPNVEDRLQHPGIHADRTYISFNGSLFDRITVFDMKSGELHTFGEIQRGVIRVARPGTVGGKYVATSFDGISFSGMSSRDVPDGGLMTGEPGELYFLKAFERGPGDQMPDHISVQVHLDADSMARLVAALEAQRTDIKIFKLHLLVELFESEPSASLSESWHRKDYGLLSQDEYLTRTAARIEAITLTTGIAKLAAASDPELEVSTMDMPSIARVAAPAAVDLAPVVRVLQSILGVLVVLTLALVFLR